MTASNKAFHALSDTEKEALEQQAARARLTWIYEIAEFQKNHPEFYQDLEEADGDDKEDGSKQKGKKRTRSDVDLPVSNKKHKPNEEDQGKEKKEEKTDANKKADSKKEEKKLTKTDMTRSQLKRKRSMKNKRQRSKKAGKK